MNDAVWKDFFQGLKQQCIRLFMLVLQKQKIIKLVFINLRIGDGDDPFTDFY